VKLGPDDPWANVLRPLLRIWDIRAFMREVHGKDYAANTPETIRLLSSHVLMDDERRSLFGESYQNQGFWPETQTPPCFRSYLAAAVGFGIEGWSSPFYVESELWKSGLIVFGALGKESQAARPTQARSHDNRDGRQPTLC
jgi:BsuBI/PstI restriction endonuclease